MLLRDLTVDPFSVSDVFSISTLPPQAWNEKNKKNRSKSWKWRVECLRETHQSGVFIRWLLIRRNGNKHARRVSAYWSPLIFQRNYWAVIPYFCTTSSQLEVDGPNGGRGRRTVTRLFFLSAFDTAGERRAPKSFLMSKQVLLIMHQHTSFKLSRNQPASVWEKPRVWWSMRQKSSPCCNGRWRSQ